LVRIVLSIHRPNHGIYGVQEAPSSFLEEGTLRCWDKVIHINVGTYPLGRRVLALPSRYHSLQLEVDFSRGI